MDKHSEGIASIHNNIRKMLKGRKRGLKGWEIQQGYLARYGKRYSESSITARLRQMMDVSCNLSNYTYRLQG
jgi:hypothetical protein